MSYSLLPAQLWLHTVQLASVDIFALPHLHRACSTQARSQGRQHHTHTSSLQLPTSSKRSPGATKTIPQSSLCSGRSGVCLHWRPTLWPVREHGHHRVHSLPLLTRQEAARVGGRQEARKGSGQVAGGGLFSPHPRDLGRPPDLLTHRPEQVDSPSAQHPPCLCRANSPRAPASVGSIIPRSCPRTSPGQPGSYKGPRMTLSTTPCPEWEVEMCLHYVVSSDRMEGW